MRKGTIVAAVMTLLALGAIAFLGADGTAHLDRSASESASAHPVQPGQQLADEEPTPARAASEGVVTESTSDQTGIAVQNLDGPVVPPVKRVFPKTPPLESKAKSKKAKP